MILFAGLLLVTSCGDDKTEFDTYQSPYGKYDELGYTVSVKYDANGGTFTTGVSEMFDTFNPTLVVNVDEDGNKQVSLIAPDDLRRGKFNAYAPTNSDKSNQYFFIGWYQERIPITNENGEALDYDGNLVSESGNKPAYRYDKKWDFSKDTITIEKDKSYTSSEPVLTLYAAWVPNLSVELCDRETGSVISSYIFSPEYSGMEIELPAWDDNGEIDYKDFSGSKGLESYSNKTYDRAFYDVHGVMPVSGTTVTHSANLNTAMGCIVSTELDSEGNEILVPSISKDDRTMRIYVDFLDGIWVKITSVDALKKALNKAIKNGTDPNVINANLIIEANLDFDGAWDARFTSKTFNGTIIGNGHVFSNITAKQSGFSTEFGLFARLGDDAVIEDLSIDSAKVIIDKGFNKNLTAKYGLLAGEISKKASIRELTVTNSELLISSGCMLPSVYYIGLVSGNDDGYAAGIDYSGITCAENKRNEEDADAWKITTSSGSQTIDAEKIG